MHERYTAVHCSLVSWCGPLHGISYMRYTTIPAMQLTRAVQAPCVSQLVEPLKLTLAQLKEYDGSDTKKPIYLAIRGVVFNVSRGEATQPSRLARLPDSCRTAGPSGHLSSIATTRQAANIQGYGCVPQK